MFGAIGRVVAATWGKTQLICGGYSPRRSSRWPKTRADWLYKNPKCVCCGRDATEVHHKIPFHFRPEWELDPDNLASVCERDHLAVGHGGNWKYWQNNFDDVAALMLAGIRGREMEQVDDMPQKAVKIDEKLAFMPENKAKTRVDEGHKLPPPPKGL